jgi:hypothetical protein
MHTTLVAARQRVVSHVDSPTRAQALGPDAPREVPDTVSTCPSCVVTALLTSAEDILLLSYEIMSEIVEVWDPAVMLTL